MAADERLLLDRSVRRKTSFAERTRIHSARRRAENPLTVARTILYLKGIGSIFRPDYEDKETIPVGTRTGGEQDDLQWGEIRVEIDGEAVTLQADKSDPKDDRLWVPFRDATSGEETSGAGRYLDLESEIHQTTENLWMLEFNHADNPTCACSAHSECPLPPETWLDVVITAGETPSK